MRRTRLLASVVALSAAFLPSHLRAQEAPPVAKPAAGAPAAPAGPAAAPAAVPPLAAPAAAAPGDPKAGAALILRALEGFGGAAAVDGVRSLELRGKGTRRLPNGNEFPLEMTTRILFPSHYRQDINLPVGTMSTVVTDKEAFLLSGDTAMPLGDDQRIVLRASFRRNLVHLLRSRSEPTFSAEKVGADAIDGTPVELVRVASAGETMTLAIDPASGRVLRLTSANVGAGVGPSGELVISYSDFRKAGLLVYPFGSIGFLSGNKVFESQLEAVVVDGPLEEALFAMPEKRMPLPTEVPLAAPAAPSGAGGTGTASPAGGTPAAAPPVTTPPRP